MNNAVAWCLLKLIRLYQITLSPFIGRQCRFMPTCSHYTMQAIQLHGPFKGSYLGAYRILRCGPWCQGGHDPVPEPRSKNKTPHQNTP
ncbi:membrane protein insertion efficiency factor YidD [Basilea psittacipulmonis]|uniref:Putative membrane protein insertion efficiency factor n=1 Tax=Basilea psittacipulmonis DSM 24701 TaxID=1072685 RepID=A0A077DEV0_9BURK|nr:membrane protein insertion efficiency factor YidD [Basilea psittacipulmonis]AIL31942.1 hypothetical protein IX83_00120 [Basilea psittacipulmonis DSM 24701]